jgi:putative oxidoreductase
MSLSRLIARPLLASALVAGGVQALRRPQPQAQQAEPVIDALRGVADKAAAGSPPAKALGALDNVQVVRINAAAQVVAGLALATGRVPRLSAAVLAASLVPTTVAGHRFWEESDSGARAQERLHLLKNASLLGGLIIAAGDTDGQPGLAWRARRAAKDSRREARRLTSSARREAKLAKAQLT